MATTDKKPSFGVALGTFVIIAAIIAYGLLGLGMDAHVPIAMAATAAALTRPRGTSTPFSITVYAPS